jgi:hypothetical protein
MPNNLNVTLDTSTSPSAVDVDQHGKDNEVSQGPNAQTITWQLTGNAASGSFVPMTDSAPGFQWISAPPDGIFGTPTVSQGSGNQLTLTDLNTGTSTQGSWTYILRINVGGTVYSTKTTSLKATTTNPVIINK